MRDTEIYYQCWLPEGEPRAVLLIVHGVAEHSGRYGNVVAALVPQGYAIYALDHIGHGKSKGRRVYVERFTDFTQTLNIYLEMVRGRQPDKPLFIVGHSMGSLVTLSFLLDYQPQLTGVVLSGVLAKMPANITPMTIAVGKLFSMLLPKLGIVAVSSDGISRDPAVVAAYENDPLNFNGKLPARLGAEMLSTMQAVTAAAAKIEYPLLLLQGSADTLVDPTGAQMLYDTVGSTDKQIKIYEGLYHELYNEPEREQILGVVADWLQAHLPS